jgi:hypothetical protein
MNDRLSGLEAAHRLGLMFDLIWLSAVWQDVAPPDRARAFRKIVTLLKPGARVLLTLRHGPPPPDRRMCEASSAEVERLALDHGLITLRVREEPDRLGRSDVSWTLICLQLPDDTTGGAPAASQRDPRRCEILDVQARAAPGHCEIAPAGSPCPAMMTGSGFRWALWALYWIRMFKPLLQASLPQTPVNQGLDRLGFVRSAFRELLHIPAQDLRIGASLWGPDARALNRAIAGSAQLIARMPAFYTRYADGHPIFPARVSRSPRAREQLVIDADWLWRFGEPEIPRHVWNAVRHLNTWIEPVIISEWARLMQDYGERQGRSLSMDQLYRELTWLDPVRDTKLVRAIAETLLGRGEPVYCVWSGKRLDQRTLDVDHCFPWVAWPCGDLWNLLPSSRHVNQRLKRDRLVAAETLAGAHDRIVDWWLKSYRRGDTGPVADRFVREAVATLAVPRQAQNAQLLDEVFAGVEYQRMRLRHDQRLEELGGG